MTQDAGPDPLVGSTVANKYKIIKLLGEGGMGAVYQAEQQLGTNTRRVALKTLHKHLSHDPSIKARFNREAGTVAALEHPNTIQVFDFGEMADGTLYLVMEFVQGRSVADILEKDGPMPPDRVINIMRQVCGSLEEAHGHGIVHRDLKPDNVVLTERAGQKDWVEVLDFGIAKRSSEHDPNEAKLTQQGMVLGTPPYMSPEQFTGQPVDLRSDIYALGIMAYEMLVGVYPFEANTAWEWASKHMTEAPRPIETQNLGPGVPPGMRAAITRALAKNKDERFGSVKEFFEAMSSGGGASAGAGGSAANFPHHPGTAMMGAPGGGGPPGAAATPPPFEAPAASGGNDRPKTEMGQPMMAPPGGGFGPPAGPPPGMGPPMGAPAAIPQAAPAQQQKGGAPVGLIVGLLGLAAVIIVVGVYFGVVRKTGKTPAVITDPTASSSVATAPTDSVAHEAHDAATPPPDDTGAQVVPLGTPDAGKVATNPTNPTTPTKPATPTKPSAKPTTPPPPPADPEACVKARRAKASNSPIWSVLEKQCIAAGGKM